MVIRPRKCREKAEGCHGEYIPRSSLQSTCGNIPCALQRARLDRARREAKKASESRIVTIREKQAIKSRSEWLKEAQAEFNRFIRERDKAQPCISCGKPPGGNKFGGAWVASHYKSVAARPELRFNELQVHKSCVKCNSWLSGNISGYRPSLIERIGEEKVLWIEGYHVPYAWTIEDAQEIKAMYREKYNRLKKGGE